MIKGWPDTSLRICRSCRTWSIWRSLMTVTPLISPGTPHCALGNKPSVFRNIFRAYTVLRAASFPLAGLTRQTRAKVPGECDPWGNILSASAGDQGNARGKGVCLFSIPVPSVRTLWKSSSVSLLEGNGVGSSFSLALPFALSAPALRPCA